MARTMQKKRAGGASTDPTRVAKAGQRDKATINRLNMYRGGKPVRNKKGQLVRRTLSSLQPMEHSKKRVEASEDHRE